MSKKEDIEHLKEVIKNYPEYLSLPILTTTKTDRGELALLKIKKRNSTLHQTNGYLFRRANYKRII